MPDEFEQRSRLSPFRLTQHQWRALTALSRHLWQDNGGFPFGLSEWGLHYIRAQWYA